MSVAATSTLDNPTCYEIFDNNADLIETISLSTWNTAIFASKLFPQIPSWIGHGAKAIRSCHSYFPMRIYSTFKDLFKMGRDCANAIRCCDSFSIALTASKVAVSATNILLTIAGTLAAFIALFGAPLIALTFYQIMMPIAITSLVIGILNQIADSIQKRLLVRELKERCRTEISKKELADRVAALFHGEKATRGDLLAIRILQIDRYTVENILGKTVKEGADHKALFGAIERSLSTHLFNNAREFFLMIIGYIALFLSRLYPETILQSGLDWGVGLLYAADTIYRKELTSF